MITLEPEPAPPPEKASSNSLEARVLAGVPKASSNSLEARVLAGVPNREDAVGERLRTFSEGLPGESQLENRSAETQLDASSAVAQSASPESSSQPGSSPDEAHAEVQPDTPPSEPAGFPETSQWDPTAKSLAVDQKEEASDSVTQTDTQPVVEAEEVELTSRPQRIHSPAIVGLVMLIVGLIGGYFVRPAIETSFVNKYIRTPAPASASTAVALLGPVGLPRTKEELMPYMIKNTRHFKGDPNAPAVLIELSDFQCQYCGKFNAETGRQINDQYIATGKVRLGYQHFAFLGLGSQQAAQASECAADQDAFWPYHDILFAHQAGGFNPDRLKELADAISLDMATFNECFDSGKYISLVLDQAQALQTLGVSSTPSFILNGKPIVGALPFETFQPLIEEALAQ